MKLSKKKVFTLALAVCLIAILSLGSLAWFTDSDSVKNDFMVAGSENSNPDDIFSVDVWENTPDGEEDQDGYEYEEVLPGDKLKKEVRVENTGSYDQYIRVTITVTNANVWKDVYDAEMVPVTEFVDITDINALYGIGSYQEGNSFVYYLYYKDKLPHTENNILSVFDNAYISENLTQEQAALLAGEFAITVVADAVQTDNVGDDVYEAFKTVGMEVPVNTTYVNSEKELVAALEKGGNIILNKKITLAAKLTIPEEVDAVIYLNGYTLTTKAVENNYSVVVNGNLTIEGEGTVNLKGTYGIGVNAAGSLTVNGGTYNHSGDYMIGNFGGKVILNEGEFNGNYCVANNFAVDGSGNTYNGKITVNGGTYTVKGTADNAQNEGEAFLGKVSVAKDVVWNYLVSDASGFAAVAAQGGKITLTKNITLNDKLVIGEGIKVIVDLNGFTLTTPNGDKVNDGNYGIVLYGDLTIEGEGTVNVRGTYGIGLTTAGTGNLTINGGYFVHEGVYMIGCFGGKVTINDGEFLAAYCVLNNFEGNKGKAYVNGGSFAMSTIANEGQIFLGNVQDNR